MPTSANYPKNPSDVHADVGIRAPKQNGLLQLALVSCSHRRPPTLWSECCSPPPYQALERVGRSSNHFDPIE